MISSARVFSFAYHGLFVSSAVSGLLGCLTNELPNVSVVYIRESWYSFLSAIGFGQRSTYHLRRS
jgi:hypothetical protein